MNKLTKSATKNFKKLGVLALLSIGAITIQSCSKDNTPMQEFAFLSITNTSPTPATFNIYVDQSKINSGAVPFGGYSGYMPLSPAEHTIKFTTASNEQVIQKSVSLETNSITSLFLIDIADKMDFLTVKDALGNISSTKAFVRFINLSPNAPALSLAVKDADIIISDKAYKIASTFIELDAKSYIFQLKDNAGNTLDGGELESFELKAGKSYTVISRGLLDATAIEKPFGGQIIINQ